MNLPSLLFLAWVVTEAVFDVLVVVVVTVVAVAVGVVVVGHPDELQSKLPDTK